MTTTHETPAAPLLAEQLSGLARHLHEQPNPLEVLTAVAAAAVAFVPGTHQASVTATHPRGQTCTITATGQLARDVDQAQYDTGQGPCLDTVDHHHSVCVEDVTGEDRWPAFRDAVRAHPVASILSVPLTTQHNRLGALNLHSCERAAFTPVSQQLALLLAAHASIVVADASRIEHLSTALDTRLVIGRAEGILMERHKITGDQAFDVLVTASQTTNRKLRDVADDLTRTGVLPTRTRHD